MITKLFRITLMLTVLNVVPMSAVTGQTTRLSQKVTPVYIKCRTEITRNAAGVEYVKVFVTNSTAKTIPQGKAINFLVNTDTRGSFSLNFALAPGQTGSYQAPLSGKPSGNPKAWVMIIDDDM